MVAVVSDALLLGIAIVSLVIAVVAVVLAARAQQAARKATRDYMRIAYTDSDVVDVLLDRISGIDASNKAVEELAKLVQVTRDDLAHTIRHVSVVKYDAFRDLAGRLSFSAALLDDSGDGIVLTNLHGRSQTQFIAKGVTPASMDALSPEEKQAVEFAMKGAAR